MIKTIVVVSSITIAVFASVITYRTHEKAPIHASHSIEKFVTKQGSKAACNAVLMPPKNMHGKPPKQKVVDGKLAYLDEEGRIIAIQHGPDVECKRYCLPKGVDAGDEVPDGATSYVCENSVEGACVGQGAQCGQEHRSGCGEYCRVQCCGCCSI